MDIEKNVEPAGSDANNPPVDLTIDDVVALSETKAQPARPEAAENAPSESVGQDPEPSAHDPEPSQGDENNAEPSPFDWERVPGTAKFRLRDGTIVSAAEIKQNWDAFRQVPQTKQQIEAERQRVQQVAAQSAQYAQFLNNVLPVVVQKARASMPQPPGEPPATPEYAPGDFIGNQEKQIAFERAMRDYSAEVRAYENARAELQQLEYAQQVQQQRAAAEQQAYHARYIETEREKLLEAMPELRDPAKARQFGKDFVTAAGTYGFQPHEVDQVADHRLILMARDAMAYRKLKTNPPKPVSTTTRPAAAAPVAQPGRRVDATEARQQARSELLQRARKQGGFDSIDDALAAFNQIKR